MNWRDQDTNLRKEQSDSMLESKVWCVARDDQTIQGVWSRDRDDPTVQGVWSVARDVQGVWSRDD